MTLMMTLMALGTKTTTTKKMPLCSSSSSTPSSLVSSPPTISSTLALARTFCLLSLFLLLLLLRPRHRCSKRTTSYLKLATWLPLLLLVPLRVGPPSMLLQRDRRNRCFCHSTTVKKMKTCQILTMTTKTRRSRSRSFDSETTMTKRLLLQFFSSS